MPILIGLGFALVLLYLWLLGHWFARVVMVLALAVLFSAALFSMTERQWSAPGQPLQNGFRAGSR